MSLLADCASGRARRLVGVRRAGVLAESLPGFCEGFVGSFSEAECSSCISSPCRAALVGRCRGCSFPRASYSSHALPPDKVRTIFSTLVGLSPLGNTFDGDLPMGDIMSGMSKQDPPMT